MTSPKQATAPEVAIAWLLIASGALMLVGAIWADSEKLGLTAGVVMGLGALAGVCRWLTR